VLPEPHGRAFAIRANASWLGAVPEDIAARLGAALG
jgi:hypothetical protein